MTDSICLIPKLHGVGGPSSFQGRLKTGLEKMGYTVHFDLDRKDTSVILVIAGTRHMLKLSRTKNRGVRIIQRLNGMNWTHRKTNTGLRHYLRAEINNWILATIRGSLASEIVYQSHFTNEWWTREYGEVRIPTRVILNGVELDEFNPVGTSNRPRDRIRIQVTEGHLGGGHELGLRNAIRFAQALKPSLQQPLEMIVAGDVPPALHREFAHLEWIHWLGVINLSQIPHLNRSAHLYFPCEINAACPNSVIEAMACGLPIIGYQTGAILEIVGEEGGKVVSYGAKDTALEPAVVEPLVDGALDILNHWEKYSKSARKRAEIFFDSNMMVEQYMDAMGLTSNIH
jgi:glycosyltransferase involved in cell wall biosynthesis